jgi:hypothetical protein
LGGNYQDAPKSRFLEAVPKVPAGKKPQIALKSVIAMSLKFCSRFDLDIVMRFAMLLP